MWLSLMLLVGAGFFAWCSKDGIHADPRRAVEDCLRGIESVFTDAVPPDGAVALVAAACKNLYVEAGCRQALEGLATRSVDPARASLVVLEACRKAYCSKLPDPKPEACGRERLPDDALQRLLLWSELQWAILQRDLGGSAASIYPRMVLFQLATFAFVEPGDVEIELPGQEAKQPAGPPEVLVELQATRVRVAIQGRPGEWTLPVFASVKDLRPLQEAIESQPGQARIMLSVSAEVSYRQVVHLMDILREAGFERINLVVGEDSRSGDPAKQQPR